MKPAALMRLLRLLNCKVPEQQHRKDWVVAGCPFAPFKHKNGVDRHPSFGISVKAPHRYRCFSCSESGPLDELLY